MVKRALYLIATNLTFTGLAFADDTKTNLCKGANIGGATCTDAGGAATTDPDAGHTVLATKIGDIVNLLLYLAGALAVIVIIYGGIRYVTSTGDAKRVAAAKDTIVYAVIGLVVAILAYAIVNFVVAHVA